MKQNLEKGFHMVTKQLDLTVLYQRLKLVVNSWIDLISFQNFEFTSECSTFTYTINSKELQNSKRLKLYFKVCLMVSNNMVYLANIRII